MFIIPNQISKQHLQTNKNDLSGTIYKSRNIDLDEGGYIKLASPSFSVFSTADDVNFDDADAMFPSENDIFINSDDVFNGAIDFGTITNRSTDTNVPTPSVEEDVVFFNDTEVVSDGSSIFYRSAQTVWTTVSTSLTTTTPTVMTPWETEGVLAVGNNNVVKFIDTAWAINGTVLTLPADYQVSSLAVQGSNLYIGTRSKSGGEAMMFVVSTIQVGIDFSYGVGTFEIMSVKPFKSSVALIVSNGLLLRFNGGGFDPLAVLPVYKKEIEWADANNDYTVVANRAMTIDGDLIYVNLSNRTENGVLQILPDFIAGIWCYDDENGSFYHRYGISSSIVQKILGTNVTVDASANDFTLTSGNLDNVVTGMPVLYDRRSNTAIPDIKESTAYYVIKNSSTEFQLATTYANAVLGTAVDITGVGTTSQRFYIIQTNDYGWGLLESRMSVAVLNNKLFDSELAGRIAFTGNATQKQATTDLTVLCGVSPFLPNRGYFVTPRLNSSILEDEYTNIHIKYHPLQGDDTIIIKYKDIDKYNYPFSSVRYSNTANWGGLWTSTTVFTTTADLSAVVVGEEVEIISGVGSGHIAFIETIEESSGTYTVTLDEAFPFVSANDIMKFNVDNYKKVGTITASNQNLKGAGHYGANVGKKSKFLMVKIEMRGVKVRVEELLINNKIHKPVI